MTNIVQLRKITKVYRFGIHAQQWERNVHAQDHFIAYKLFGHTTHESNGKCLEFSKDCLMIANSEDIYRVTKHELEAEGQRGGCIAVHFTTVSVFDMHLSVYDCTAHPQIKSKFFRMLDTWNQCKDGDNPTAEYACISHFYAIFSMLSALIGANAHTGFQDKRLDNAKEYIDRNYADSTLSISDVASVADMSQRRLTELFMERFQKTPGRYLRTARIRAATQYLRNGQYSIAEISTMVGYTSSSYFIRVFHQEMGMSPAVYRSMTTK